MVNCSYCDKELDRLVFCTPSHKVLFHRRKFRKLTKSKPIDVNLVSKSMADWQSSTNLTKEFFTAKGKKRK